MKKNLIMVFLLMFVAANFAVMAEAKTNDTAKKAKNAKSTSKTSKTTKKADKTNIPVPECDNHNNGTNCNSGCLGNGSCPDSSSSSSNNSQHNSSNDYDHSQNGTIPAAHTGYPYEDSSSSSSSSDSGCSSSSSSSDDYSNGDPYCGGGSTGAYEY